MLFHFIIDFLIDELYLSRQDINYFLGQNNLKNLILMHLFITL